LDFFSFEGSRGNLQIDLDLVEDPGLVGDDFAEVSGPHIGEIFLGNKPEKIPR